MRTGVQLWPLLLSKAVMKLMSLYDCLDKSLPEEVPAFCWLTGWVQEARPLLQSELPYTTPQLAPRTEIPIYERIQTVLGTTVNMRKPLHHWPTNQLRT